MTLTAQDIEIHKDLLDHYKRMAIDAAEAISIATMALNSANDRLRAVEQAVAAEKELLRSEGVNVDGPSGCR